MPKSLLALVGRPNVGKSTLFNRLTGVRASIVEDVPGTTRDRLYGTSEWRDREFGLVDTGGLWFHTHADQKVSPASMNDSHDFAASISDQVAVALSEADIILFLTDVKEGLAPADQEVARVLRHHDKPVLVVVNKAETESRLLEASEFWQLGLGEPHAISALHGDGVAELLDTLYPLLALPPEDTAGTAAVQIALVGRPNVGKSSLLNALLQEDRAITSEIPGTTRDSVDTDITYYGQSMTLIDTAGIRRRGRIGRGIEKYSVLRSARSIDRADVALLLLDAVEGVTAQDTHIAGMIEERRKGVVLLVNKWDAVPKDEHTLRAFEAHIRSEFKFLPYAPVVFISAHTHQRLHRILPLALEVQDARQTRIATGPFNQLLQQAYFRGAPPSRNGQPLRLYYGTQTAVSPPSFVIFVNNSKLVHFSYQRYIENAIRQEFPFAGTPISLEFRTRTRTALHRT